MKNTVTVTESQHPRYTHRVRFFMPDGKRVDRYFSNETDALAFKNKQESDVGVMGSTFGAVAEDERAALAFWRTFAKDTSPAPPELLSVLKDFKTSWLASKASVTVSDAVAKFLAHQEAAGASPRHVASLRSRLDRFTGNTRRKGVTGYHTIGENGNKLVSSITSSMFSDWLNGLRATRADKEGEKLTAVTRHSLTRSIRSFFVFAMERGWTLTNPVPVAKRSKSRAVKLATRTAPAIMLPADVARFMAALSDSKVASVKAPSLVPFWALKFFAGIRDAEAAGMDWSMIDLDAGQIHLPAGLSKTGEARTMKIEPNLDAWLRPYAKQSGDICPGDNTRKRVFKKAVDALAERDTSGKITKAFIFPSNAARHSFGTYHLFHFRNAGETALQLGHKSNPAMLHEHYKNSTAEKHAAAFWKILPAKKAKNITNIEAGRKSA